MAWWDSLLSGIRMVRLVTDPSQSGPVEIGAYKTFSITMHDSQLGPIASAKINITGINAYMLKSTGGNPPNIAGITQPIFNKADGLVYCFYRFLPVEWLPGDEYTLQVNSITVQIDSDLFIVQEIDWSNELMTEVSLEILEEHAHAVGFVRPSGAPGVTLAASGVAWTLGAFSLDIIAAADALLHLYKHDIHWYEVSDESANADYEVVLYGTVGGVADTEVDRIKFTRNNATTRSSEQAAHMPRLDAGSRMRAKVMDSVGTSTCRISVHGHPYI
jgi:hypothetical protein